MMPDISRVVFQDQFPRGADLEQAARDSLIRYARHHGLRYSRPVVQWGAKWQLRGGYWICRLDVQAVRITAEVLSP